MSPDLLPRLDLAPSGDGAAPAPFPRAPQGWTLVCAARDLRPGAVRRVSVAGQPAVAFRGRDGRAGVLAAHCPHMGAHLGGGQVTEAGLACPLHGWTFDAEGTCRVGAEGKATCAERMAFAYPVEERHGAVFAFNGPEATHPLPALPEGVTTRVGRPVRVDAPWEVVSANGFDAQHLQTVHGRALRDAPDFGTEAEGRAFFLRYRSRVTGTGLSDRAMKWVSKDRIEVDTTCFAGTMFVTESRLPGRTTRLLACIVPTDDGRGTTVWPIFVATGRGLKARAEVRAAAWLFTAFLMPDVDALRDMRFQPPRPSAADAAFLAYLDYLRALPQHRAA